MTEKSLSLLLRLESNLIVETGDIFRQHAASIYGFVRFVSQLVCQKQAGAELCQAQDSLG